MSKQKLIIGLTVLMDVIGIGIVLPSLPFYIGRVGGAALVITYLSAVYSICSFLSTPILGALSDRIGRRPVLIVSIISTAIGWFVFASAKSLPLLFLGRIIDGLAAGNISTSQSYLVDIAKNEKERTHNLGIVGAIFGVGLIIGPLIGGALSNISPSFPFWTAGMLATINAVAAYFYLPESNKTKNTEKMYVNPFRPIMRAWDNKKLAPYFIIWTLFGMATSGVYVISALYFADRFGFSAVVIGLIMAVQGLIMAVNQAFGMKRFWLRHFKEPQLVLIMFFAFALGYLFTGLVYAIIFFIGLLFSVFSQSVLRAVFMSEVMGLAKINEKGEVMGILGSVVSLGMIIGPLLSGPAYHYRNNLSFLLSALYMFIAFGILFWHRKNLAKIKADENAQFSILTPP